VKVRAATVSVAGVAALAASVMLAGCGSGSKTASSSTAPSSTESASSSAAASTSSAESTSAAESSTAADTALPVITVPELPGWSDDPTVSWSSPDGTKAFAGKYGDSATLQVDGFRGGPGDDVSSEGIKKMLEDPNAGMAVVRASTDKDITLADTCEPNGGPVPATMGEANGYRGDFSCNSRGVQGTLAILAIPGSGDAPGTAVLIVGRAKPADAAALKEAVDLVLSEGTVVP